jgi:hypothetical protein
VLDRVVVIIISPVGLVPGALIAGWRWRRRKEEHERLVLVDQVELYGGELSRARIVHDAMFPPAFLGHVTFEYEYQPIHEIGGDYVHTYVCPETGRVTLTLLDVAGHGLAAALTVNRLFGELERILIAVKTTPLADVLHHWHAQPEFMNVDGSPARLPFRGDKASFTSLVRAHGGDVPAGAMRTEMKRVGVLRESEDGYLELLDRTFKPESDHEGLIAVLVHGAYALLSNIAHNTDPNRSEGTWANRFAYTQAVRKGQAGQLRRITRDRISEFAESVDDIFMAYETLHENDNDEGDSKDAIAIGVFYFEERDENATYNW